MNKRVYISADYDADSGDRNVVTELYRWSEDERYQIEFTDMAKVVSGSVSENPDCRKCDLKAEFNRQINLSSAVIFVVGDKTAIRTAGAGCERNYMDWYQCNCTPYKQNVNGSKCCKHTIISPTDPYGDVGNINSFSYLRHEFEQAKKRGKKIIIVYNSLYKQESWLPYYMYEYKHLAEPFWIYNDSLKKVGNYQFIRQQLGYE